MSQAAAEQDVIALALRLDPAARGRVADALWASLEALGDAPPLSPAWTEVIDRRLAEIDAGTAQLIPADDVFRRLRAGRTG